ncbi:MAG: branched chain amino acid aminotransferase [Candidatus Magasanikbacteria bacterium]|nr:branched chain amino acid aminotransferase [Candidatus Magasanikbacteria bacterium]|tara:strand:- start:1370 stop:2401 length:1032 start_codon:yes stop_codon:yes gene_type:complete
MAKKTIQIPPWSSLGFSYVPTSVTYTQEHDGHQWEPYKLTQSNNLKLHESSAVLNYGQGIFEGMKARRDKNDSIMLFRPRLNAERFQRGATRMCMPQVSEDQFINATKEIVLENIDFLPPAGQGSLYIRPLLFGSGPKLGIGPAPSYTFIVYVSPVRRYFNNAESIRLLIPENIHRAMVGGTGNVKANCNYPAGMYHVCKAKEEGFDELLYLDARHNTYIEECGAANFFAVKDGVLYTPPLGGTILPGITRRSVLEIADVLGIPTEVCLLKVSDVFAADECFCTGTATGIVPVGRIVHQDKECVYNNSSTGPITQKLKAALEEIKSGDPKEILTPLTSWNMVI